MKHSTIKDERILQERRKIQSTGYAWIVIILLASVIVQQFFMHAPFAQYAVEFFLLIGCGLYNTASTLKKGIDIWNPAGHGKKKLLLSTIGTGIISVIFLAFLSGEHDVKNLAFYFVTFVVGLYIFRMIMIGINKRKQQAMDRILDEEEEE